MAANRNLILAGVKGGGTAGSALALFGPSGTTLPTAASGTGSTLDSALKDAGWCTEDGLKKAVNESQQTIKAFGTNSPVRKLTTESEVSFELTFLESNPTVIEIYNRLPLGSVTVDTTDGSFDFTEGQPNVVDMCAVFDLVDGGNLVRAVVPQLEVTGRKEFNIKSSEAVTYGVTLTAYPGSDGVAVHWYYLLSDLAV